MIPRLCQGDYINIRLMNVYNGVTREKIMERFAGLEGKIRISAGEKLTH